MINRDGNKMEEKVRLCYEHVTIGYERQKTVEDVSFSLHTGEILGLVGESGSGKSTLIRAALGLPDDQGEILAGRILYCPGQMNIQENPLDLCRLSEREMRRIRGTKIGMVFQNAVSSLCPIRTIGSQMKESLSAHRKVKKNEIFDAAEDLFEKLHFENPGRILKSYPFELSGGMNQRIGIAMAMLAQPEILLADEPTSALDAAVAGQVLEELRTIRNLFGTSILFVSHDLGAVSALADRTLILADGRVIEEGRTGDILHAPRAAYTKQLMAAVPQLRTSLAKPAISSLNSREGIQEIGDSESKKNKQEKLDVRSHDFCQVTVDFKGKSLRPGKLNFENQKPIPDKQQAAALLSVDHLSKTFYAKNQTDTPAVRDISFSLRQGEILGLVGESGSGKSTVARLLTGLLPMDEGKIRVREKDPEKIRDNKDNTNKESKKSKRSKRSKERSFSQRIQMVFQDPLASFDPRKTLGYGISESLRNRGLPKGETEKLAATYLADCGLPGEYMNRYPREVSGGQCQRAAIARALTAEPEILICDEATSSLDVTAQQQIAELLKKLQVERNLSILFISHSLPLVQVVCDRILVMKDGKIVEQGMTDEIIRHPKDEYTKFLVRAAGI